MLPHDVRPEHLTLTRRELLHRCGMGFGAMALGGMLAETAGRVVFEGRDITGQPPQVISRLGLVRSFQVTRLFKEMTPEEHVAAAVLQRTGRAGRMFGHHGRMTDVMDEVRDILDFLHLGENADVRVREIAYGQQRLLELADGFPRHRGTQE